MVWIGAVSQSTIAEPENALEQETSAKCIVRRCNHLQDKLKITQELNIRMRFIAKYYTNKEFVLVKDGAYSAQNNNRRQ